MKYAFIKDHQHQFSVRLCCELMKVSRSGFYDWLKRKPRTRTLSNHALDKTIKMIFAGHKQRAGSPRIAMDLQAQGICCSENRVARRMKALGLRALAKRKYKVTTDSDHNKPLYDNVLQRDFATTKLDQKWVQEITYIRTQEGSLYLAVVLDLHS